VGIGTIISADIGVSVRGDNGNRAGVFAGKVVALHIFPITSPAWLVAVFIPAGCIDNRARGFTCVRILRQQAGTGGKEWKSEQQTNEVFRHSRSILSA
jgi:hypothetical protein